MGVLGWLALIFFVGYAVFLFGSLFGLAFADIRDFFKKKPSKGMVVGVFKEYALLIGGFALLSMVVYAVAGGDQYTEQDDIELAQRCEALNKDYIPVTATSDSGTYELFADFSDGYPQKLHFPKGGSVDLDGERLGNGWPIMADDENGDSWSLDLNDYDCN